MPAASHAFREGGVFVPQGRNHIAMAMQAESLSHGGGTPLKYRLCLLGDTNVGKSSLAVRFVRGIFANLQDATVGGTSAYLWGKLPSKAH